MGGLLTVAQASSEESVIHFAGAEAQTAQDLHADLHIPDDGNLSTSDGVGNHGDIIRAALAVVGEP